MMPQSPRVGAQVRHPGFWPVPPNSMRPRPKVKMGRMGSQWRDGEPVRRVALLLCHSDDGVPGAWGRQEIEERPNM